MNNTLFDTARGDVTQINMPIGQQTPNLGTFTNLHATGTTELDGAVSGAGFTAAVKAIAGAGQTLCAKQTFIAPLPADLVSVIAAVTPSNTALTIAAQPPHARKLQIRIVIGTTTTTEITAGNLALVFTDQDGNAITENHSLITASSVTVKTTSAVATLTSATITGYVASGGGTGNAIGLGAANDFGVATGQGTVANFACVKASKNTRTVTGSGSEVTVWTNVASDDNAASATVDPVARTIAPATTPAANGLIDFEFTASYSLSA